MKKAIAFFVVVIMCASSGTSWADNGDRILDLLLKKKMITQEEYDQIKKRGEGAV